MKRIVIVLFMAFLISSPFVQRASSQLEKPTGQHKTLAPPAQATKNKFLFFQLPASETATAPLNVEFRIRVDNFPYLVEKFIVDPESARLGPAIEVLGSEPERLKNLYRLVRKENRKVNVIVMADGKILRTFSLKGLREYTRVLINQSGFRPVAFQSRLFVLRSLQPKVPGQVHAASNCEGDCYDQYANCAAMTCGDPGVECDDCYPQLNACLAQCPPPPPPTSCPSTSCHSTAEVIGATWYGYICAFNVFQELKQFDHYYVHYKITTTCTTTDPCAGTQSTSSTYRYTDQWCDFETFFSCSFANGWPFYCY